MSRTVRMLAGTVNSHSFVLSCQFFRGSTVRELDILLDELALTHRNLVHLEGERWLA